MPTTPQTTIHHDHDTCVSGALTRAEALCASRGTKLTPIRRQVLELVWSGHRPRGAYAILDDMKVDGKRVAPLTVYRALDFLVENGLVHRLESLNAYIGCPSPDHAHPGQFLVCRDCGDAIELNDQRVSAAIADSARARGFQIDRPTVEVRGLCPVCQNRPHPSHSPADTERPEARQPVTRQKAES
ncbi:Fur family transcriptional regulator [Skermanella stibiiresistens SB22]|uniref:Fur family transcriptional regulator n=1 Tax=Skermanella stibiiresistens SB22 TaxID=1385369 RepID=W9GY87_9PROT|nr:Fur family transcriptional regulator [Skermanella stibiiresistens]EWY38764.1 Fur family transcriptional regulator [Skermanella stibiiresistens SB22]